MAPIHTVLLSRRPKLKIPPPPLSIQSYKISIQSCKHPRHQIKKANHKKFLQKFKSSVTFAPLVKRIASGQEFLAANIPLYGVP